VTHNLTPPKVTLPDLLAGVVDPEGASTPLYLCPQCQKLKVADDFWRFRKDGVTPSGRCRACQSSGAVKSAQASGYKAQAAAVKQWRHGHPEKARAQARDGKRVLRGTVPALPCEVCGEPAENHHESYADDERPRRLCRRCHNAAHDKRTHHPQWTAAGAAWAQHKEG